MANRRDVLKGAGLLVGSTMVGHGSRLEGAANAQTSSMVRLPNILVILTDQERQHTHWPPGLLDRLMPSWSRLRQHGITFERAYAASAQCSPSRACLLTGEYSNVNGVPTLPDNGMPTVADLPNIATVLEQSGYDVIWKGKWHLSFPLGFKGGPPSAEVWTEADIAPLESNYRLQDWNPPDCGNAAGAFTPSNADDPVARAATISTAGGGTANNDNRILMGADPGDTPGFGESVLEFFERMAAAPRERRKPFALFLSLVNPHDITFFPDAWQDLGYGTGQLAGLEVPLPPNFSDDLTTKPSVQAAYRDAFDEKSPLDAGDNSPLNYVNFYAYLHSVVEPHIQQALDALDHHGLTDDTIIVRTADHGELGLSHGLREKSYSAYEEMIHVPLVISNPILFPEPAATCAFSSHVDLLPTLAELGQASAVGVGKSLVPVLLDPTATVQESILFAFDDNFILDDIAGSHIRAIREGPWTYAVYYSSDGAGFEFEMYDLDTDPLQMNNLVFRPSPGIMPEWLRLHQLLIDTMANTNSAPVGFPFPNDPRTAP
jgi:arylsulfatase A-like enzyme